MQPFQSAVKLSAAFLANSPLWIQASTLEDRDGNWSIERTVAALPYFDAEGYENTLRAAIASWAPDLPSPEDGAAVLLGRIFFENYAGEYHRCLEDRFFADFRNAEGPHVALGGSFFPIQDARGLDGCLFLLECHDINFNLSQGVIAWRIVEEGLRRRLAYEFADFLTGFGSHRALASVRARKDPHISTFAGVLVMAREQAQEERIEVAFLLGCTVLEHLLVGGASTTIARTLSRRLGALQSFACDISFQEAVKGVRQLYDTRSQFAHEAKAIRREELDRLMILCESAYLAALQANVRLGPAEPDRWIGTWHTKLDYVAAALDAGVTVDGKTATDAGVS